MITATNLPCDFLIHYQHMPDPKNKRLTHLTRFFLKKKITIEFQLMAWYFLYDSYFLVSG